MRKIIVLSFILCLYGCDVFSQQRLSIEDLGPQAQKEWQLQLDVQPSLSKEYPYAVLRNGVVTYSKDTQTLTCVDFEGRKLWEKSGIPSPNYPIAPPNGEYLYTYRLTGEEKGISTIWNTQGEMLWQHDGEYGYFEISPSGKYMFSYYSYLNPSPLKVLDIKTGTSIWELERVSYWQAAASENDRLVYYEDKESFLKLYELSTGRLLWEKSIGTQNNHYGSVHMSDSGCTIVFQDNSNPKMERYTYIYDGKGNLLWEMTKQRQRAITNGGIVRAVSDDGQFLAMSDLHRFMLFSIDQPDPIWALDERMRPQYVQEFADGVLAFRPHPNNTTRVMVLDATGAIKNDYLFLQRIEFKTPGPGQSWLLNLNRIA